VTSNGNSTKKKQAAKQPRSTPRLNEIIWFNPKPNTQDIKWLEDRGGQLLEDSLQTLDALSPEQRVTLKYDVQSSRWLAILFNGTNEQQSPVHALSVRASTPIDALGLLSYFHNFKFADGWEHEVITPTGRFG